MIRFTFNEPRQGKLIVRGSRGHAHCNLPHSGQSDPSRKKKGQSDPHVSHSSPSINTSLSRSLPRPGSTSPPTGDERLPLLTPSSPANGRRRRPQRSRPPLPPPVHPIPEPKQHGGRRSSPSPPRTAPPPLAIRTHGWAPAGGDRGRLRRRRTGPQRLRCLPGGPGLRRPRFWCVPLGCRTGLMWRLCSELIDWEFWALVCLVLWWCRVRGEGAQRGDVADELRELV